MAEGENMNGAGGSNTTLLTAVELAGEQLQPRSSFTLMNDGDGEYRNAKSSEGATFDKASVVRPTITNNGERVPNDLNGNEFAMRTF